MSALTSLIHLSTVNWIDMFFVAVSEGEPFISHAEALVDALLDSNSVLKGRVGSGHGMFPLTSDLAWSTFSATCLTSDPDLL